MGVKERKERERRQRWNEILEAARRVFESKGFLRTTLQDVAKEAEISVGLIYRYFRSKEDIFASLALKGAETFDDRISRILPAATSQRKRPAAESVLRDIATAFFDFYEPYGEYFDMLMYSYKGFGREVQINGVTLTRLMSVTLTSLDRLKTYFQESDEFAVDDEDEALKIVFVLWGTLLGVHKLFDGSGRGHLFAFRREDFISEMIGHILRGIATPAPSPAPSPRRRRGKGTEGSAHPA